MEMKAVHSGKKQQRRMLLCLLGWGALLAALLLRLPCGFDWSDEVYQAVLPYRFILGDRPLIDTWEVHQFSGLIALPFLRLFLLASGGSTTGVLLYFRIVNTAVQALISLYGFFVLRRRSGDVPALLSAGLILMHAHYAMNNFFYNSMTLLFLLLSALLLFDGLDRLEPEKPGWKGGLLLALSGGAFALAVQAYPYLALALPVWAVFWAGFLRRRRGKRPGRLMWLWLAGILAVFCIFLAYLLPRCPLEQLCENLRFLFADPDHAATDVLHELGYYGNAARVLFGPVFYGALALAALGIGTCLLKNETLRMKLRRAGLAFGILLIAGGVAWMLPYDYPAYHKINLAAMAISLAGPGLYFLSGRRRHRGLLLYALGFALSMGVQLGSNTRVRASFGMMLPASIGTLLYLFDAVKAAFPEKRGRMAETLAALACAAQLLLISGLRVTAVYRDAPIAALTATVESGPARGLRTTPESAAAYEAICGDILENAPERGTILMTNLMPVGYLLTTLTPATPSAYNMTMDAPWLGMYYAAHPEREPDYIFAAGEAYGISNIDGLKGAGETYAHDPAYRSYPVKTGTVFRKIDS